ncbi:hypothetical protein HDC90_001146 [Pedobacter sp. AK013]|uniref:PcfK-like family protein n=1 Tax=Pedobacter sp. AK013 TaxID=2723071 RepID=UPI00160F443F|nr:PcfK-like family protein [Pedobacter sp. AK013]MBB6236534.1 hypothetical protein [Pedobacter sp. AK013]
MAVTPAFNKAIADHLQQLADTDPLFAETFKKPAKNIDDCCTYILNEVKESGKQGFADDEIFNMAVHYYDEDDIKPGAKINGRVVVNHSLGAEPKVSPSSVKKEAIKKVEKPKKPESKAVKLSLF